MDTDRAYAAGLIDGEGTIGLTARDGPFVSMSSTTSELTDFMHGLFGGHVTQRPARQEGHSAIWVWKVTGRRALSSLEAMLPYLRERHKRLKAEMLVGEWTALTPRNGKYSQEQRDAKAGFLERFRQVGCSRVC